MLNTADSAQTRSLAVPTALLSGRTVSRRVVFSLPHIARLEHAGAFPRRRILGPARIGWSADEITAWMQSKLNARGSCPFGGAVPQLGAQDRFLSKREVSQLVVYSGRHIDTLERAGRFPRRIAIGAHRRVYLAREIAQWISSRPAASPGEEA
ncbi:MAG: AlpA family phage regulatory protein [Hyphomicrobium sp.]|nr:AlpA family phage regulatory protein [Hyphomicrobium sp.]